MLKSIMIPSLIPSPQGGGKSERKEFFILPKSKIFLILCLSFIIGVWLGKYVNVTVMAILAMFFVVLTSLGWKSRLAKVIGFAGLLLVAGCLRLNVSLQENKLASLYNQPFLIEGVIIQEPDVRFDKTFLTLGKLRIQGLDVDSKILITSQRFPDFVYGDFVSFTGKIVEPKDAESKGEFSYRNYLSRFGIEGVVYYPKLERQGFDQANPIQATLLKFKRIFVSKLSQLLPEPHNSFLSGILVGMRRGIPQDLLDDFNITGTTHIIALSGFNITIIAQFIDWLLLNWFSRRISFLLSFVCIVLFVIMTGASASIVRAGVMGILGMLALNIGRLSSITNALALTGAVMVGINPKILHFDLGFQLSFLALMGLVYLSPLFSPYFWRLGKFFGKILSATLSAQIFVIPVLLYNFERLSLVSPLTNILVLPFVPFAMLFGFLAGLVGLIQPILAYPFVWIAWAILEYIIKAVDLTAGIPFASITLSVGIIFVIVYYLCLFLILWKFRPKPLSSSS